MGDHFEKGQHALLNEGEENEMEIFGYRTQSCRKTLCLSCRKTLCLAGSIFSFGILPLVFYWKPAWHVWANCIPCSLQEADVVLLRTTVSVSIGKYRIKL
uniref:Cation-transporting ATPase n=1 Tax=Capra hircus TaxID=9925 RepID=A0A8C2NG91_CAPHI